MENLCRDYENNVKDFYIFCNNREERCFLGFFVEKVSLIKLCIFVRILLKLRGCNEGDITHFYVYVKKRTIWGERMGYKCYRMVYHLENGKTIKDIKEFCYRDHGKMLERVAHRVMDNAEVTAIDKQGTIISIACDDIVKVELDYIKES